MNIKINAKHVILTAVFTAICAAAFLGKSDNSFASESAFYTAQVSDQTSETVIKVGASVTIPNIQTNDASGYKPDDSSFADETASVGESETSNSAPHLTTVPASPSQVPENLNNNHEHDWVPVTQTIHHKEEGHYENVKTSDAWDEQVCIKEAWDEQVCIKEAWDEQVCIKEAWDETVCTKEAWDETIYTVHTFCSTCHFDYTANGYSQEQLLAHDEAHLDQFLADWAAVGYIQEYTISPYQCDFIYEWYAAWGPNARSGWHDEYVSIPIHHDAEYTVVHHDAEYQTVHHEAEYQTVHHDAEHEIVHHDDIYENKWIVDKPAWDETITTGYRCKRCGEIK